MGTGGAGGLGGFGGLLGLVGLVLDGVYIVLDFFGSKT